MSPLRKRFLNGGWTGDPSKITRQVAVLMNSTVRGIRGTRKHKGYLMPRLCAALALRIAGLSYPEIGHELGGRNHATIIHEINVAVALWPEAALLLGMDQRVASERLAKKGDKRGPRMGLLPEEAA